MGFSIVARARARIGNIGDRQVRIAERIERVDSVDLIVEPGAGGALLDLIEAHTTETDHDLTKNKNGTDTLPERRVTPVRECEDMTMSEREDDPLRHAPAARESRGRGRRAGRPGSPVSADRGAWR